MVLKQQKNIKVAIVAELLIRLGGAERVVKSLMEIYPEAKIFTLLYDEEKCGNDFPKDKIQTSFLQKFPKFIRKRYRWLIKLMPYAIESFDFTDYDLVISSSSAFAHGALTSSETLHICYCHSPMRYAWDYSHQYLNDKWFNPIKRFFARRAIEKIRIWDRVAADRVDFYVANSKHVQKRIEKYYRLPSEVIYPPVNVDKFQYNNSSKDYFIIISTLTSYKKIDLAINLFNKIGKKLIIVGDGPEREFLESIAGENIEFKGRISDLEVQKLLEESKGLIFPSEEDFGISMIEAMAAGRPVLAYKAGGALEFIEAGINGEFFNEQNLASMEDALARLINNENKYSREIIRTKAEKFSEEIFKNKIQKFINEKIKAY